MTPLESRLIREIRESGSPLRFDAFMERALFDPEHGYYASGRARIGREGDFHTSVSVGRMFGRVLAEQFAEVWRHLGSPVRFDLVEQGANDGQLAADILEALEERHPACFASTRYTLVEPFAHLVNRQRKTLEKFTGRAEWRSSLDEIDSIVGVHFTNEYADALPVRLFRRASDSWLERHVMAEDGALAWVDLPAPDVDLPSNLPENYLAELRPAANSWLRQIASRLNRGLALIIDYGFAGDQLLAPWRTGGTLSCYRDNRRDDNPLESPGEKDITAHVNFTALARTGIEEGLHLTGFTDQYHFLVGAGTTLLLEMESAGASNHADLRAMRTLFHPETMGTQFKYLALTRNLPGSLCGFRHARPASPALGLDQYQTAGQPNANGGGPQ